MKLKTGVIRRIDELGRIVLPKEFRKVLGIEERDFIEMSIEDTSITLNKYENKCTFCGRVNPRNVFKEKKICKSCLEKIKNEL